MIQQGDVFWVDLGEPRGRALAHRHPYVVVQGNVYNQSKIGTAVICGLTSKLHRADYPGNVLLKKGEANLPKDSVVNVTQFYTVDKNELTDKIGTLNTSRVQEIIRGINVLLDNE